MPDFSKFNAKLTLRYFRVVCSLSAQPIAVGQTKKSAQPKIRVRRNGALASDNIANALGGYTDLLGQAILAQPHRLKELLQEYLTGGNGF